MGGAPIQGLKLATTLNCSCRSSARCCQGTPSRTEDFKTNIVMLPVVMLNARATSRIIFAIGGVSCHKTLCLHVGRVGGHSILNAGVAQPLLGL